MEKALHSKKAVCFFVLPGLILFAVIVAVPIIQSANYSLLKWNGISKGTLIGLKNYIDMINDPIFLLSLKNSLLLAAASVLIQMPISMILALILANGVKAEDFFRNAFFIPVIISSTVIANLWLKIYHPSYGLLNVLFVWLGHPEWKQNWLGSAESVLVACFIPMIWKDIGYNMLLFYSSAKSISQDIIEAARVDGATRFQISTRIILPLIIPMIEAVTIFCIVGSLKSFDMIFILTDGGPVHASSVLSLMMYNEIFSNNHYGYASAIAIAIIIICLLFTVLVQFVFKKIMSRYRSD
ncbi:MAG: sugar ABC transporter permease [Mobilitalea sp.]